MGRLSGKVALITGAARGQGRAEAERLADEGADIIAIDIAGPVTEYVGYPAATREDLKRTARLVEEKGRRVVAREADVRDFAALSDAVAAGLAELGRLDVVVANAGICNFGRLWELELEQWRTLIDTNLTGVFHTLKATVPPLIEGGAGGSIIVTSSVAGLKGLPFLGHYAAAKHGVVGLCRTLANELAEYDIRVNTVHPHGVNTDMGGDGALPKMLEGQEALGAMFMPALPHPVAEPDDIANLVAFLACDESKYITGSQLRVDLGNINR